MSDSKKSLFLLKEQVKEAENILRKKNFLDNEKNIYLKTKLKKDENIIKLLNESLEVKGTMESKLQADLRGGKKILINKIEANFNKELESLRLQETYLQNNLNNANKQIQKLLKDPPKNNQVDLEKIESLKIKLESFKEKNSEFKKLLKEERLKINELEKELKIKQKNNGSDQTEIESETEQTLQQETIDDIQNILDGINTLLTLANKILKNYFEHDPIIEAMHVYKSIMSDEAKDEKIDDKFDRISIKIINKNLEKYAKFTNSDMLTANKNLEELRMKNQQLEIDEKNYKQDLENLEGQNKTNAGQYIGGASFFVSFSDVISVLLCFFVVFFAIGELDSLKFNKLLSTFSGDEIRPDTFNARVSNDEFAMLEKVKQLAHDNVDPQLIVQGDTRTIEHIISGSDLFAPGEFKISPEGINLLKQKITNDLKDGVKQLIVEGHTDDKELTLFPKALKIYQNNLAFSAARAGAVAQIISKIFASPKELVNVTGYGAGRPLKPNTSDANRALNRRVVIKILKGQDEMEMKSNYSFDNLTGN